jgi:hypothetical protein
MVKFTGPFDENTSVYSNTCGVGFVSIIGMVSGSSSYEATCVKEY